MLSVFPLGPGRTQIPRAVYQLCGKREQVPRMALTGLPNNIGSDNITGMTPHSVEMHKQLNLEVAMLALCNKGSICNLPFVWLFV